MDSIFQCSENVPEKYQGDVQRTLDGVVEHLENRGRK